MMAKQMAMRRTRRKRAINNKRREREYIEKIIQTYIGYKIYESVY